MQRTEKTGGVANVEIAVFPDRGITSLFVLTALLEWQSCVRFSLLFFCSFYIFLFILLFPDNDTIGLNRHIYLI